ncbi:MAG TPA: CehA/McbA family metallohydrolase [Solirubrobacteraceae bacterium]|nr:CehA/McbA family metallohydrolase [Solirubrobacteraceae bacterium]
MTQEPLAIAHVTPYPWGGGRHEITAYVERVTAELAARGHRVLIVAPSRSQDAVRDTRAAIRAAVDDPASLLPEPGAPPRVLAVGDALPDLPGAGRRVPALPVDVSRTIEDLLTIVPLDVCHVHEPFAPSTSSAALRHSRALNVGTFHAPTERLLSTQVARKVVQLVFGRLDARTASFATTCELMQRWFPAEYRVLLPGADPVPPRADRASGGPIRIGFADDEERGALRLFLRALRRLEAEADWEVTVVSARGPSSSTPLRSDLEERVRYITPEQVTEEDGLGRLDVLVAASDGAAPVPTLLLRAMNAGVVPLASRLPVYEEALDHGERGLLFEPRDIDTLAAQLARLVDDGALRERLRDAAAPLRELLTWQRVADELEDVYAGVVARRHPLEGNPELGARLRSRPWIDIDLHMHTDHSHDCATPVEVLLATAREQGLGAIAVTDHNVITGALEAREKAAEFGMKVIVAEEVKTADQGEVIGLFIEEQIPRGLTLAETIAEIKRQGGLVYVPHPFDRMHAVPDYEHLLGIVDDIDAIEIYNPRVAIGSFNEEAERFAAKYRIVAGAGSDSHVAQGLGSVRVRVPDFDGPEEFLEALRHAEITTKPSSLLYVQALKFLETKATPPGARAARRERRVRRATRKS